MAERFTASATISMEEYLELKEDARNFKEIKETLFSILFHVKQTPLGHQALCNIGDILATEHYLKYHSIELEDKTSKVKTSIGHNSVNSKTLKLKV